MRSFYGGPRFDAFHNQENRLTGMRRLGRQVCASCQGPATRANLKTSVTQRLQCCLQIPTYELSSLHVRWKDRIGAYEPVSGDIDSAQQSLKKHGISSPTHR